MRPNDSGSSSRARLTPRISAPRAAPVGTTFKIPSACIALFPTFLPAPVARAPTRAAILGLRSAMRAHERTNLAHRQRNPVLGLLPRIEAHFGFRREHRG